MASTTDGPAPDDARNAACWLRSGGAALILHMVLVLPNRLDETVLASFLRLPVELPLLMLALLAAPARLRRAVRGMIVAGLALLVLLKIADTATYAAFARPFNAVVDLHLATAGWTLLSGAVGTLGATASLAALIAGYGAILVAVAWATRVLSRASVGSLRRPAFAVALTLLAGFGGLFAADVGHALTPVASIQASRLAADHARFLAHRLMDAVRFRVELSEEVLGEVPPERLLADLRDTDVLLLFVESYGRSSIENPLYARTVLPILERFDAAITEAGFAARSAWTTSPTYGGQSWLAHASFLSGVWVDNQRRYDSLIVSDRRTLMHDFRRAGWRTVGVMPAINMAWPDGTFFGYDRLYAGFDLGYEGEPFNWVTMPDQYTLSAFATRELAAADRRPVMAEIVLISSHAPWTPIPPVLPWEMIGDGSVFTPYARSGDAPEVVWRDADRIRDQYRISIEYVLSTLKSFVTAFGSDDMMLIIVGDHQPAAFVSGQPDSHDVPIHIIARGQLLKALDGWNWASGMVPHEASPVWRMDAMRERILRAFSQEDDEAASRSEARSR